MKRNLPDDFSVSNSIGSGLASKTTNPAMEGGAFACRQTTFDDNSGSVTAVTGEAFAFVRLSEAGRRERNR